MNIVFEKIPFEDYLAFLKTQKRLSEFDIEWARVQHKYLKNPKTYEEGNRIMTFYCPDNFYIAKGKIFTIPTGFKCESEDISKASVKLTSKYPFMLDPDVTETDKITDHIVLKGIATENFCISQDEPLFTITFFYGRN